MICCKHCGNDGAGDDGLYLAIDARWRPAAAGWELQEREDSGGVTLDCLACDGQTEIDRAALFPFGLIVQPPGAPDLVNHARALLAGLRDVRAAFEEPHYGDRDQQADSVFDALQRVRPVLDALAGIDLGGAA